MPHANIWIRKENWEVWKAIPDKSDFINSVLSEGTPETVDPPKNIAGPAAVREGYLSDTFQPLPVRDAAQVAKEAYALKDMLDAEKADNEFNQDPDYWDDFSKRYKQIDALWAEYHALKGTQ